MINKQELKSFNLNNFKLKSEKIVNLQINYVSFGNLNSDKSNVILYPNRYAGTHLEQEYLIGEGQPLNPENYFYYD